MKRAFVVGAGQLGSRHLQALKAVKEPLRITVVDPSSESLRVAAERFSSAPCGPVAHEVEYLNQIPVGGRPVDVAVVATNSDVRRSMVEALLDSHDVQYMILEKLLFKRPEDYQAIDERLGRSGSRAWVNCTMRKVPFYRGLKDGTNTLPLDYRVTGSRYGLITNAIHYVDHIAYLANNSGFTVDTSKLDPQPIPSKRRGFLELTGTLEVHFKDGSRGSFSCVPEGDLPVLVEIFYENARYFCHESAGVVVISKSANQWKPTQSDLKIPYQSQMTSEIVEELLHSGTCPLVSYPESARIHLTFQSSLLDFLNCRNGERLDYFPFT